MIQSYPVYRLILLLLVAVAATTLLAACSNDDDSPDPEPTATVLPVEETAPEETAPVDEGAPEDTAPEQMTAAEVVDEVRNAVVTVVNEQTVTTRFGTQETQAVGSGTGFIIDEEGYIVTNWHVVTGGTDFSVILADGTEVEAEHIGEDPRDDLAVVRIDPSVVPDTVPLGDSSELDVAQTVLAIGSPLGAFDNTVTKGIVSSLNRDQFSQTNPSALSNYCQNYTDLIQHDAAINPGNSGGPLFNLQGEVIGVNTLGLSTTQGGQPVQGLYFAVPSDTVAVVVDQLISQGFISAPYMGITFQPLNPRLAAANDLPVDYGVYVIDAESGGPAAGAGIQPDDIVISVDGRAIDVETSLSAILFEHQPGDTVELTLLRGEEEVELPLTLGEAPQSLFEQCTLETGR